MKPSTPVHLSPNGGQIQLTAQYSLKTTTDSDKTRIWQLLDDDLEKGHSNDMLCCFLSVKLKDGAQSALMEKWEGMKNEISQNGTGR